MLLACGLPIIVIFLVFSLCLLVKPTLARDLNNYFESASGLKLGHFQKNNKGETKTEWLIMTLGVVALLIAIAPVQTLLWISIVLSDPASPAQESMEGEINNVMRCMMGFVSIMCFSVVTLLKPRK